MKRRVLPSGGFAAIVVTYAALLAFFFWGLSTPELDRIWELHHLLKVGRLERLEPADKEVLTEAMARYDALAEALLGGQEIGVISSHQDGWLATPCATVLRTAGSRDVASVSIVSQTPEDLLPLTIAVDGEGWKERVEVTVHGRYEVALPPPGKRDELIEVCIQGKGLEADPSVLGTRLLFGGSR